jgi:hypothetical protein
MFNVLMVNIRISFFYQVFDCFQSHTSNRIVQRRLSVLIDVVWISLHFLYKSSYNMEVTFSCCIENWCLAIAINMVWFAAFLIKEF